MKSEPDAFGIDDLAKKPKQTAPWDGVRNFQARNFLRDEMKKGDLAFFYHSSCDVPGVAGIVRIVRAGYPDHTAWDKANEHFDSKSTKEKPLWFMVDVKLERKLKRVVSLAEIKATPTLKTMRLVQRGNRLSILPVTAAEWKTIVAMEKAISKVSA
jgi:predicted RNA-binding protein with PUA-like domain